jgi:hypothetical protein
MAFGLTFFDVAPGLRIAGDSLAFAYKFTKKGGDGDGAEGLEIGLTDDPTVKLLETAVSGYTTVSDRDSVYTALVAGGLTELVPGLAVGIDSLSSIETNSALVKLALAGSQPVLQFRRAAVQAVTKVGAGGSTWDLPGATFDALKAAADAYESDMAAKVEEMIAARISADGVLQAAVDAQAVSDATARAAIQAALDAEIVRVNGLVSTDMWLFATQGDFPAAADNHGRVVHSHADGAMFYAHGGMWHQIAKEVDLQTTIASVANEATAREASDNALGARLDVLEADPTTQTLLSAESSARASADTTLQANIDAEATARVAGDAAALSSANSYTDTAITNLTGAAPAVLDTLGEIAQAINDDANVYTTLVGQIAAVQSDVDGNEADSDAAIAAESSARATAVAAVQADVDQNESDADAAAAALSGRLDVLEADPTTATALAAVQADVDQNEADGDAADAALSTRLDTLEADPTTATAVAAVQADVDQNEVDADAAIALKAPLADPDFTGVLEVDTNARLEFDSNLTKVHNVLRGTSIVIGNNITLNPAAADGRVEVEGEFYLRPSDLTNAADDTAAAAAGIIVGQVYRNGSQLMVRVS